MKALSLPTMAAHTSNPSTQEQQEGKVLQLLWQASHDYVGDTFKPEKE